MAVKEQRILRMNSRGQLVIPGDLRKKLNLQPEEYLVLRLDDKKLIVSKLTSEELQPIANS